MNKSQPKFKIMSTLNLFPYKDNNSDQAFIPLGLLAFPPSDIDARLVVHLFTWGLLITVIVLGALLDKRLSAEKRQLISRHIVLVVVVIGWICFMIGLYLS